MPIERLVVWLGIGAVAGWLAGLIVKGYGFGLIGNSVVGLVGAFIAGFLLPRLGIVIGSGIVAAIINAVIGAVILLVILGLVRRETLGTNRPGRRAKEICVPAFCGAQLRHTRQLQAARVAPMSSDPSKDAP